MWSSCRVGGVPLGRGPSSLGYFALDPWVVVGVSLGTSCLLLACLLFAPCLPRRKNASLQGGGFFFFLFAPCLPGRGTPCLYGEVAFPRVAAWLLYRVGSLLGPPRYGLLWWGRSFIHRPKVNLPARRDCPRRDVWLFVVQYVTPVGISPLILPLACRDAARRITAVGRRFQRRRIIALRSGYA